MRKRKCSMCSTGRTFQVAGGVLCDYCGTFERADNVITFRDLAVGDTFVVDTVGGTLSRRYDLIKVYVKVDSENAKDTDGNIMICGPLAGCVRPKASKVKLATVQQISRLQDLNYKGSMEISKQTAGEQILLLTPNQLPKWAVGWCHYCGEPAARFNFFDVPACRDCD